MTAHEQIEELGKSRELLEKLSPKFAELTLDLDSVFKNCKDPMVIAVLLFKLAEEREHTNKLIEQVGDKFDKIMFELKTGQMRGPEIIPEERKYVLLPEQDQKILGIIQQSGSATAEEIQGVLQYRGKNAACQRLNLLVRQGLLRKAQSGRRVLFLPPTI